MEVQSNWEGVQPGVLFIKPVKGIFLWNIKGCEDILAKTNDAGVKDGTDAFRVSCEVDAIACPETPGSHGERYTYTNNGYTLKMLMAALNVPAESLPKQWAPERILPGKQIVALFVPEGGNEYEARKGPKAGQKVRGDLFEVLFGDEVLDRCTKYQIDQTKLAPQVRAYAARGAIKSAGAGTANPTNPDTDAKPANGGAAGGKAGALTPEVIALLKSQGVDVSTLGGQANA